MPTSVPSFLAPTLLGAGIFSGLASVIIPGTGLTEVLSSNLTLGGVMLYLYIRQQNAHAVDQKGWREVADKQAEANNRMADSLNRLTVMYSTHAATTNELLRRVAGDNIDVSPPTSNHFDDAGG